MKKPIFFILVFMMFFLTACLKKDISIERFEGGDFKNWTVEGEAFGNMPASGAVKLSKNPYPFSTS